MIEVSGYRYDGRSSARQPVRIRIDEDSSVHVTGDDFGYECAGIEVRVPPRVGGIPAQLRLPDGSLCELEDGPGTEAALTMLSPRGRDGLLRKFESRYGLVAIALIGAVVMIYGIVQYGIPLLARYVAAAIPPAVEEQLGRESLELLDRLYCRESKLPLSRQAALRGKFQRVVVDETVSAFDVQFRDRPKLGANAFALPGGTILFTDGMVALAVDDRELQGVFGHELGHLQGRHTMRHVLQDSAIAMLLILVTGDAHSASSLAAAVPTVLVQARFSRAFEREADAYAVRIMERRGISPRHLANLLMRLEAATGGDVPGFLSTHPATSERVKILGTSAD